MPSRTARAIGLSATGLAAVALVGAGAGAAFSAPHLAPHARSAVAHTPHLKVTISKKKSTVKGPTTFAAGRVALTLKAVGKEEESSIVQLSKRVTFKSIRADVGTFFQADGSGPGGSTPKSALKLWRHVLKNVTFYGGLDAVAGQTERATVMLRKPGTYLLIKDTGLPTRLETLTVTGPAVKRAAPNSSATVTALTQRRFGGATTLPHRGTITFKNRSTESPHFLTLIHVKEGTTVKQVLEALESNGQPTFFRRGQAATDPVSEGQSMTLSYNVPKGEYIEICFFPDPETGMPHAFMGMERVVHLK
jgi:hypothetical protein